MKPKQGIKGSVMSCPGTSSVDNSTIEELTSNVAGQR